MFCQVIKLLIVLSPLQKVRQYFERGVTQDKQSLKAKSCSIKYMKIVNKPSYYMSVTRHHESCMSLDLKDVFQISVSKTVSNNIYLSCFCQLPHDIIEKKISQLMTE